MSQQAKQSFFDNISDSIWKLFISLKFTVVLLVLWLFGSVAGTFILQNGDPAKYVELYGTEWSNIMLKLGLFDVYHNEWYSLILLLLMLNIIACSLNTLPGKLALAFKQPKTGKVTGSGKRYVNRTIRINSSKGVVEKIRQALGERFKTVTQSEMEDGGTRLYAHKQSYSHFMIYIVHLGIVVVIVGAVVSGRFGFEGIMEIPDGESRDYAFVKTGTTYTTASLDFTVKCDEFEFQRFADGRPKDWYSTLTIVKDGNAVKTKKIEVNDPISFEDYIFYQSSYVEMAPLKITDTASGKSAVVNLRDGQRASVDSLGLQVGLNGFMVVKDAMSARVVVGSMESGLISVVVSSDEERNSLFQKDKPFRVDFASDKPAYSTGLMVVADPGVNLVWLGSFLFTIGLYLTFYSSHRRIMVEITDGKLELNALAQRNVSAFSREIDKILKNAGFEQFGKSHS